MSDLPPSVSLRPLPTPTASTQSASPLWEPSWKDLKTWHGNTAIGQSPAAITVSRSVHSLRRYIGGNAALLRLDPRLERSLPADLRRDQYEESVISRSLYRKLKEA